MLRSLNLDWKNWSAMASTAGRLSATVSLAEALADADVALICVGTPSEKNGNLGLDQLRRVSQEIAASLPGRTKPLIVAVRSTVYPGTCEEIVLPAMGGSPLVSVVSNPEFLREGAAVSDFMEPSLLVVGGSSPEAVQQVAAIYSGLPVEPSLVALRTAEMIKYACNAFHAVKISFANEIGALAGELGIDGAEVMDTLCRDHSLNISPAYLKPGFAFGGSCLPKDLRALVYRASRLDLKLPLLESVLPCQQRATRSRHHPRARPPGERIGVFGLAFKENTDDLRESPVVLLLETLIGKGRKVRVHDPHIQLGEIYGSNQRYIMNAIPHIGNLLDDQLDAMLEWADHVLVAQKPSPQIQSGLEASGKPLIDLVGALAAARQPRRSPPDYETRRASSVRLRGQSLAHRRRRGVCPRSLLPPGGARLGKRPLSTNPCQKATCGASWNCLTSPSTCSKTPGSSPPRPAAGLAAILKRHPCRYPAPLLHGLPQSVPVGGALCAACPKCSSPTRARIPKATSPPAARRGNGWLPARLNLPLNRVICISDYNVDCMLRRDLIDAAPRHAHL